MSTKATQNDGIQLVIVPNLHMILSMSLSSCNVQNIPNNKASTKVSIYPEPPNIIVFI